MSDQANEALSGKRAEFVGRWARFPSAPNEKWIALAERIRAFRP